MKVLEKELTRAFDMYKRNGDIYEFAIDMLTVGRRSGEKKVFTEVMEMIFKEERKHPKHIPFRQSARYLRAQGKKGKI